MTFKDLQKMLVRKLLIVVSMLFLPFSAYAFELHVRENDPGLMRQVDSIEVEKTINFENLGQVSEFEGTTWGYRLEGVEFECIPDQPLNPNPRNVPQSNGKVSGTPSVPLTTVARDALGTTFIYRQTFQTIGSISYSYAHGCGHYGDSTWAMVFDQPRTAFSISFIFHHIFTTPEYDHTVGERYHLEFWGEDGSLIGHQDILDSDHLDPRPCPARGSLTTCGSADQLMQTFAWISDVPVAGFSAWPQNGPGMGFNTIQLGSEGEDPDLIIPCDHSGHDHVACGHTHPLPDDPEPDRVTVLENQIRAAEARLHDLEASADEDFQDHEARIKALEALAAKLRAL